MPRSPSPLPPRHSLTLCASLVENPLNLGALCRTAEVFRLRQLVLPSMESVASQEFRKLAVSAHQWQPLAACPVAHLSDWIEQQRSQGAAVYALARHPTATALPAFHFPHHTTLLLGRELTGIPDALISQCDGVVEIPQFGQVESLNVATAAAIAAYSYLCQHAGNALSPE